MRAFCRGTRGSGLLMVLVIIVVAGFLVAAMVISQGTSIKRSGLLMAHDQAVELLAGFETWAAVLLKRDRAQGSTDNLGEEWALPLPPVPTDSGTISGGIIDLQGRINVNNLVLGDDSLKELTRQRLLRLFDLCGVDPLALEALEDWLDDDDDPRPMGAEADYYLDQEGAGLPANSAVDGIGELAYLRYLEPEGYHCLKPNLAALPVATPVNVNTAGPMVLATLAGGVDPDAVEDLVPEEGFESMDQFLVQEIWKDKGVTAAGLALASDFFLVRAESVNDLGIWGLESLVDRSQGAAVMRRTFTPGQTKEKGESS